MSGEKPLKVLHLTTHLNIGGITSYLSILGGEMARRGHDISIVSGGGDMEETLAAKSLSVYRLPIRTKSVLSPKLWFALPRLVRFIKKEKFDLIHAHTRVTQVLASWASFWTKVPFMSTAHGYYKPRIGRRVFKCWGRRVVAISPLVAEELEKSHNVPKSKVRIVFNAIDLPEYRKRILEKNPGAIREAFGIERGAFVIGSVSRLVRDKGHEYLVEAVSRLAKKHPNVYLVICGDGREKNRLEALIGKDGLVNRAKLIPSHPDITGIFSILDVFVHPATFREGFGLTLLEAMAAKIPVVASNIWAINSIIRNHVNGFLVQPKNAKELADTLSYIIENQTISGSIAQNGFEMALRDYSVDRMAGEMETVYKEVINMSLRGAT
jgi:glycosyltransferase involved in cell wall biosynthesis